TGQVVLVIGKYNETGGSNDTSLMGRPSEIWVDPADNEVFIADGYGNRRIIVFAGATGKYLRHWGAYGRRPEDPPARGGGGGAGGGARAGGGAGGRGRGGGGASRHSRAPRGARPFPSPTPRPPAASHRASSLFPTASSARATA